MKVSEMLTRLQLYIDDTVESEEDAIGILNDGKNRMALAVKATFPDVTSASGGSDSFVFPTEYHEGPVLYAAAMYKAVDSSIQEKNSFMGDFQEILRDFQENYDPPMQYQKNSYTQHFVATAGQLLFTITGETFTGKPKVYINSQRTYDYNVDGNEITLYNGAIEGDILSAVWDENAAFTQPPYPHWRW